MKIWIIIDNIYWLAIMNLLSKYDHEYYIYIDNHNSFYGDKKREIGIGWVKKWIEYLQNLGVEKIILPPTYELAFLLDDRYKNFSQNITNIYISYIKDFVAKHSIVGKLWFVWDLADMEFLDIYILEVLSDFTFSENQAKNKFFNWFVIYKQTTPLRKYLLNHLSATNHLLNHSIKTDLRKIKPYNIDTLIPLNYSYFSCWKTIKHDLWKIKFHDINVIKNIWEWLSYEKSDYNIYIYLTNRADLLLSEKKRKRLLCRGKTIERNLKEI